MASSTMFSDNFMERSPRATTRYDSDMTTSYQAYRARSRSVSPCSSAALAAALPDDGFTLSDLAAQFAGQRLRRDAQMCYDSCEAYANNDDDDAAWRIDLDEGEDESDSLHIPTAHTSTASLSRPHSPTQRMQRQVNARLLCSTTHHRDIAALVANMVSTRDQCSVVSATTSRSPTIADDELHFTDDDEGYKSDSNAATSRCSSSASLASLTSGCSGGSSTSSSSSSSRPRPETFRRACDRRHITNASVCKAVRFRRESRPSHGRSRCV